MAGRGPIKKYNIGLVLEHYGQYLPGRQTGRVKVKCVFHGDKTASAVIDYTNKRFTCYACGVAGDAIDIIVGQEGVGVARAIEIAEGIVGGSGEEIQQSSPPSSGLFDL